MPTDTHVSVRFGDVFSSSSSSLSLRQTIQYEYPFGSPVQYNNNTHSYIDRRKAKEEEEEECYSPFESIHHTCSCSRKTVPPLPAKERERNLLLRLVLLACYDDDSLFTLFFDRNL